MCGFCNVWVCICVGFVMCGCVYEWVCVCVVFVMCGCFDNCVGVLEICTCIYCVLYCLYCIFVLFRLRTFILICCVCTGVRTTATE